MNTGIYIHIPFCRAKCNYCSFVSLPWDDALAKRYLRAVVRELEVFSAGSTEKLAIDTIYIGGGTPSLLPAGDLESILETCRNQFAVAGDCEISLEANPGTLTPDKLNRYLSAGVNRISMGAQSFSDDELAAICRIHTSSQIIDSCRLLRDAGLANFSLDLMLGLPGQTEARWRSNLMSAIALEPAHLSIYMLELDAKAPLGRLVDSGRCKTPDEDAVADWYLLTIDILEIHGFPQYEISNFARPGCECRHNLKYWRREPALGLGVAAHSHDVVSRYANTADLNEYLGAIEAGRSAIHWREPLTAARALEETIFLGLRLRSGLDWEQTRGDCGTIAACEASLRELAEAGLLEWRDSMVRLSRRGMLLSNEIFQRFVQLGES